MSVIKVMGLDSYIYDQSQRDYEEEPEEDHDVCDECGQHECVCSILDGFDDGLDGPW